MEWGGGGYGEFEPESIRVVLARVECALHIAEIIRNRPLPFQIVS